MILYQKSRSVMSKTARRVVRGNSTCKTVRGFVTRRILHSSLFLDKIRGTVKEINVFVIVILACTKMERARRSFGAMMTCTESRKMFTKVKYNCRH